MSLSQTREQVLCELFSRVSRTTFASPVSQSFGFRTSSRRLKHFADVSLDQRPALFMTCHTETPSYRSESSPAYQKIDVRLFVYLNTKDDAIVGDTDINVVLDALDTALSPGVGEQRLTLGGLVSHCRVDGEIMRDPGDLDGDGIIIVPISMTLT